MNKKILITLLIVVIVVLAIVFVAMGNNRNSVVNTPVTSSDSDASSTGSLNEIASASTSPMQSTGQLFSASKDFSKAYLIYPTTDAGTAKALAGFAVRTKDLGNGTTQVSLASKTQNDEVQYFTVSAGQKVYFVEKSFGDDSLDNDRFLGDDYGVAVDANGFILK